jgi:hypothetical protein
VYDLSHGDGLMPSSYNAPSIYNAATTYPTESVMRAELTLIPNRDPVGGRCEKPVFAIDRQASTWRAAAWGIKGR